MLFNTMQYLLFLLLIVLIYYILPKKVRYLWLLGSSYYFYMQWSPIYILLLFFCTVITYVGGLFLQELQNTKDVVTGKSKECTQGKKQLCLFICIFLELGVLFYFKYFEFGISLINRVLGQFELKTISVSYDVLLPVGISFYTLQTIGYLIDVYYENIYAERNFFRYALFVSFFPQLVAGPIERSKNLLMQLHKSYPFTWENCKKGCLLITYGMFLKVVIADRMAILVDEVYGNASAYQGWYIVVATCFFAIQIYCDFYGYTTIARGSALLMGIHLVDNFQAPYLSRSIKEFWRRWHISLSGWFRDYLYIPLGGNRRGKMRKEENLLVVFGISGLWHGASLSFCAWGLLHGLYQIGSDIFTEIRCYIEKYLPVGGIEKQRKTEEGREKERKTDFATQLVQVVANFMLVTFAWLFFRSGSFSNALNLLKSMTETNNWRILFDGSLQNLGVTSIYFRVLEISIIVLFTVDYFKYKDIDVADAVLRQKWWFQAGIILIMWFVILLYGCYGELYDAQQFIYFQF